MKIVKVDVKTHQIMDLLLLYVHYSIWFEVDPLPGGRFEIRAKNEEGANKAIEHFEKTRGIDLKAERFTT